LKDPGRTRVPLYDFMISELWQSRSHNPPISGTMILDESRSPDIDAPSMFVLYFVKHIFQNNNVSGCCTFLTSLELSGPYSTICPDFPICVSPKSLNMGSPRVFLYEIAVLLKRPIPCLQRPVFEIFLCFYEHEARTSNLSFPARAALPQHGDFLVKPYAKTAKSAGRPDPGHNRPLRKPRSSRKKMPSGAPSAKSPQL
jgi:hypothetical protein